MISVIIELAMGFAQYFAFITDVDVDFPDSWSDPMRYFNVVNLDFDFLRRFIPAINDIRVYFILVSIVVPLVFVFVGLFFLNKKRVVLWYFLAVFAVMLIAAGAFGSVIAATADLDLDAATAQSLLYAGIALLVVCLVLYLINKYAPCLRDDTAHAVEKKEVMEIETKNINVPLLLERVVYMVVLAAAALILGGVFDRGIPETVDTFFGAQQLSFGLAITFAVFFVLLLVWTCMGLSRGGRQRQWEVTQFFESSFLKILLVSMSIAYIPIGSAVILMFNCNEFSCPAGYRLPDRGSSVVVNSTAGGGSNCVPCVVASGQLCPSSIAAAMCASATHERLEHDVSTDCAGMRTFFWPASFLIVLMYVLGVPLMFHSLIRASTVMIQDEFPASTKDIATPGGGDGQPNDAELTAEEQDAIWMKKVAQSNNCARFLFSPFEYRFRYVRLFQLIQKLLIVATSVYIVRNTAVSPQAISLGCSLAIHFVASIMLIRYAPFISKFEDRVAALMSSALTIACVVAILLLQGVEIPTWLMIVLIVLNGVLPVVALIVGIALEWASSKKTEEETEKEKMRRLAEEMQKRQEAEQEADEAQQVADAINQSAVECGELPPGSAETSYRAVPMHAMSTEEMIRREKRRKLEARVAVQSRMEEELILLHEKQETVDLHIDRLIKGKLNRFLMIAGVFGFLALGCALLGLIVRDDSRVLEPFPAESTIESELVSYTDWRNFTFQCCCALRTNRADKSRHTVVETWLCANKRIKERVREVTTLNAAGNVTSRVDGRRVREFCSVDFAAGCSLVADRATGEVNLDCDAALGLPSSERELW